MREEKISLCVSSELKILITINKCRWDRERDNSDALSNHLRNVYAIESVVPHLTCRGKNSANRPRNDGVIKGKRKKSISILAKRETHCSAVDKLTGTSVG